MARRSFKEHMEALGCEVRNGKAYCPIDLVERGESVTVYRILSHDEVQELKDSSASIERYGLILADVLGMANQRMNSDLELEELPIDELKMYMPRIGYMDVMDILDDYEVHTYTKVKRIKGKPSKRIFRLFCDDEFLMCDLSEWEYKTLGYALSKDRQESNFTIDRDYIKNKLNETVHKYVTLTEEFEDCRTDEDLVKIRGFMWAKGQVKDFFNKVVRATVTAMTEALSVTEEEANDTKGVFANVGINLDNVDLSDCDDAEFAL